MSETAFDRTKHKVTATRKWVRSGVVGAKDKPIEGADLGKLSDEDIVSLRGQGLITVADGRGEVKGDLAPAGPGKTEGEGEAAKK